MFFFPRLKNYSLLSLPPPESNIAIKNKRKPRVARYYSNFKTRSRLEMDESDSYLLLLLPRQFQFPSETTQHPPLSFPSPSLFLFIYKFVTLTHSLTVGTGRKMFVEEFLTARTSSSQQQIYRISIFTISIYVANMLYNNSLVSFCRFFIISPRQFLLLAIVLHFTCWVKISKTGNSLGDR